MGAQPALANDPAATTTTTSNAFGMTRCGDKVSCSTADLVYIRGGESASVQCIGVREGGHNRANVARSLKLRYEY